MRQWRIFVLTVFALNVRAATSQTSTPVLCADVLRPTAVDSQHRTKLCVEPSRFEAGDPNTSITVYGTNFIDSSRVRWIAQDGSVSDLVTTLGTDSVSGQKILIGSIPAAYLKSAAKASVVVFNPSASGGQPSSSHAPINIYQPCGTEIGQLDGVPAKSNGRDTTTGQGCEPNFQWECVDYIKRYYHDALGLKRVASWSGDAYTYFDSAKADVKNSKQKSISTNKQLDAYANGSTTAPAFRDILVWNGQGDGHVAIIESLHSPDETECVGDSDIGTKCTVTIIQQNVSQSGTSALTLTTIGTGSTKSYYLVGGPGTVQGWLRAPDANVWPTGSLDGVSADGTVFGWAQDSDNTTAAVIAQIFIDKDVGTLGANPINVRADQFRSDVQNHAFDYSLPNSYRDGLSHMVWVYAIDSTDGTRSFKLPGSGLSYPFPSTGSALGSVTVDATLDGSSVTAPAYTVNDVNGHLVSGPPFLNLAPGAYTLNFTGTSPSNSSLRQILPCGILTRVPTCTANLIAGQILAFTLQFTSIQTESKQLTNSTSRDCYPVFGSNGTKILFSSNRNNPDKNANDIWDMNPDGTAQREIVHVVITTPLSWGDPGLFANVKESIGTTGDLVVTEAQFFHEVMRVRLSAEDSFPIVRTVEDGPDNFFSDLVLVPGGLNVGSVVYSNATQQLAWIGYVGNGSQYQLRIAPLSQLAGQYAYSVGNVLLTTSSDGSHGGIDFAPDGQRIVASLCLQSCSAQKADDLYIIDAVNGQVIHRITTSGDGGVSSTQPRWSPNGAWIAFVSNKTGNNEIWAMRSDGTDLRQITSNGVDNSGPAWSPDSTSLAFGTNDHGNYAIWVASGLN